jgi:hypothetical protein
MIHREMRQLWFLHVVGNRLFNLILSTPAISSRHNINKSKSSIVIGWQYVLVDVTRLSIRARSRYPVPAGPESCHDARRGWRRFCRNGTNFIEHYACRGTIFIEVRKLLRYIGALLRADARVRVQGPLRNCLGCRCKSKKCDNPIKNTDPVMWSLFS